MPIPCPENILKLVSLFRENRETYKSSDYKEDSLRKQFLDPLFEALEWDVYNRAGYAEAYKDVMHEDSISVGGHTKAPDYCFRIGGQRKFFVEAKKPSVNIATDSAPAFQLRRYGYSAKLPLNILTDFEEFSIYDCRKKPTQNDKVTVARIECFTFEQLSEKWDYLVNTFSPEAIKKGSFDRYAKDAKNKRGTGAVDDDFLETIEGWRLEIAKYLARHNPSLTERSLNAVVQKTIDRILFLRIAEDRGIETYGTLLKLTAGKGIYPRLSQFFRAADDRYNSGLFHFRKEKDRPELNESWHLNLDLGDAVLKPILEGIYYPESPYEFSVMPVEILGQVYEKFLGNVITLSDSGKTAKVEQKPEVRKAGGVYYTPQYIVDYIVEKTVGTLCTGKKPSEVEKLKVLDPACGSGSFLIGAYQYLLDWHLCYYLDNKPETLIKGTTKTAARLRPLGESYALTTAEKKRILLNNIYGVDIDAQAVEVTKLSLLLKVLEGENDKTLAPPQKNLALYSERVLPDLAENIRCGNSLIAPDYWDDKRMMQGELALDPTTFTEEDLFRVNTFDWHDKANGFGEIMANGGFDAVIGNPPYFNIDKTWGAKHPLIDGIKKAYPYIHTDKTDILFYFIAKSTLLVKEANSCIGLIVSRAFLEAYKAIKLRTYLSSIYIPKEIVDFRNYQVFEGIGITTTIIIMKPVREVKSVYSYKLLPNILPKDKLSNLLSNPKFFSKNKVSSKKLGPNPWHISSSLIEAINHKIDNSGLQLSDVMEVGKGMETGRNNIFGNKTLQQIESLGLSSELFRRRASNSQIQRYRINSKDEYLIFLENVANFNELPIGIQKYLNTHKKELQSRAACKRNDCEWWKFTWHLHLKYYGGAKLLCPYMAKNNRFALDLNDNYLGLTDTTVLFPKSENILYLLGILNSRLLTFRFRSIGKLKSNGVLEYFWNSISRLPIRTLNLKIPAEKKQHDKMIGLVETILELNKRLATPNLDNTQQRVLEQQIQTTDQQIDALVYQLYELTPEEIKIVEDGTE